MSQDIMVFLVIVLFSIPLGILVVYADETWPMLVRWWNLIKKYYIAIGTAPCTEWEKYKLKMARDAQKRLDYDVIRLMEFDCYEGKVFHLQNGECALEPFPPKVRVGGRFIPSTRNLLELEIERKDLLQKVGGRYAR